LEIHPLNKPLHQVGCHEIEEKLKKWVLIENPRVLLAPFELCGDCIEYMIATYIHLPIIK
jgi:hypothetical protein